MATLCLLVAHTRASCPCKHGQDGRATGGPFSKRSELSAWLILSGTAKMAVPQLVSLFPLRARAALG